MFTAVDPETGNALGTSSLVARMGSVETPNVVMQLRRRQFFSEDLQSGATHVTAQVMLDTSGPTEIGGLILGPSYRGHPSKIGKQLSLIRFHFIGLHRERFQERILAEMMAPITAEGANAFWEHLTRRFINLTYEEADRFCQKSREFMISLLPREEIYLSLLPPIARESVGKVGADTVPARRMLEGLGFSYRDRIDPFDGGPHLEAETDDITLVRSTRRLTLAGGLKDAAAEGVGFVSHDGAGGGDDGEFRAVFTPYAVEGESVRVTDEALETLGAGAGVPAGFTPIEGASGGGADGGATHKGGAKRRRVNA
jgi:arginine N-succinyltransferase